MELFHKELKDQENHEFKNLSFGVGYDGSLSENFKTRWNRKMTMWARKLYEQPNEGLEKNVISENNV